MLTGCRKGPLTRALIDEGPRGARRDLDGLSRPSVASRWRWRSGTTARRRHRAQRRPGPARHARRRRPDRDRQRPLRDARRPSRGRTFSRRSGRAAAWTRWRAGCSHAPPPACAVRPSSTGGSALARGRRRRRARRRAAFDLRLVAPRLPAFSRPEGMDEYACLVSLVEEGALARYGSRQAERVPGAWARSTTSSR